MIEYMIIALIVAKFCEKGAIDIVSMITGRQPPSMTVQRAKKGNTEDGPIAKALKAWYADAIEDLDEARRIKRMETKEERERARAERKAERQRIIDAAGTPPAEEPPHPDDSEADAPPPFDQPVPGPVDPIIVDQPVDETVPDRREAIEEPIDAVIVEPREVIVEEPPEAPEFPAFTVIRGDRPEDDDNEWRVYGRPQLHAVPTQKEGPEVTTMYEGKDQHGTAVYNSGGTGGQAVAVEGGISTHIDWTAKMVDYHMRAMSHAEIVGASMYQGDNGPERLALIAQIQDGHRQMADAYQRVHDILVNDKIKIGDAYASTGNQAGNKVYVTDNA